MKNTIIHTSIILFLLATTITSCVNKKTTENKPIAISTQQTELSIRKINVEIFKTEIDGKNVQLVDVRTPNEFENGHLENATNINIRDKNFMEQMSKYKKNEPVYVYCRSGGRSMKAAKVLKANGYNVVNMNGGFTDWSSKGYKSVK